MNEYAVSARSDESSHIEGLATRRRVKGGAVEQRGWPSLVLKRPGDDGVEAVAVRVCVVDARGHAASAEAAGRSK